MALGTDLAAREENAAEASRLLRLIANEKRLLVLCHIVAEGEMGVGAFAEAVDFSQPALSQHPALLREESFVARRKEAQAVFYRPANRKAACVLALLRDMYCPSGT